MYGGGFFNSPSASEWSNVLLLTELLFLLPASNGRLERLFSILNVIKTERRSLSNTTLKDLLVINCQKVPLQEFNADPGIDLWWQAKTRRINQKQYKNRHTNSVSDIPCSSTSLSGSTSTEEETFTSDILGEWDDWLASDDSSDY